MVLSTSCMQFAVLRNVEAKQRPDFVKCHVAAWLLTTVASAGLVSLWGSVQQSDVCSAELCKDQPGQDCQSQH